MELRIDPISRNIEKSHFNCGIEELNNYIHRYALQNDRNNIGKSFVAVQIRNPKEVIGYYTVSMAQILFKEIPEKIKKGLPKYPVPAMRLGKLAVDVQFQGNKIGAFLLRDALLRAVNISSEIGIYCVIVDAINGKAESFYRKYGFVPCTEHPNTLILPLTTIAQACGIPGAAE